MAWLAPKSTPTCSGLAPVIFFLCFSMGSASCNLIAPSLIPVQLGFMPFTFNFFLQCSNRLPTYTMIQIRYTYCVSLPITSSS